MKNENGDEGKSYKTNKKLLKFKKYCTLGKKKNKHNKVKFEWMRKSTNMMS